MVIITVDYNYYDDKMMAMLIFITEVCLGYIHPRTSRISK